MNLTINHSFLTDKKRWIEEDQDNYYLLVNHQGKTYKEIIEKGLVRMGRLMARINYSRLNKSIVNELILKIQVKIHNGNYERIGQNQKTNV